jgi:iron complex transport system ATP-binding protein
MLNIQSLTIGYSNHPILSDLTMNVPPGQVLAVVGPNGTGKTTLIRTISGVIPSIDGTIQFGQRKLEHSGINERARFVAVVPQAHSLPNNFSIFQTVLLGRTPYLNWLGHTGSADNEIVEAALKKTGLTGMTDRLIGELSGGEQQLVLLARALAQDTPILLLDEPTAHLDIEHQSHILSLVRNLALETNKVVLMVVHDLNLAALYADRIAMLSQSRLYALGSPDEVLTSENLGAVYHIPTTVIPHPVYGTPLVLPEGPDKTAMMYPLSLSVTEAQLKD